MVNNNTLTYQITREQVDDFKPGCRIPSCQLKVKWTSTEEPTDLIHTVKLLGAKEPFNFFSIALECWSLLEGKLLTISVFNFLG